MSVLLKPWVTPRLLFTPLDSLVMLAEIVAFCIVAACVTELIVKPLVRKYL